MHTDHTRNIPIIIDEKNKLLIIYSVRIYYIFIVCVLS